jgi:hypothetical protein
VREVVNQEGQHHEAGEAHRARSQRRAQRALDAVRLRGQRAADFQRQADGRPDVDHCAQNDDAARDPEQRPEVVQELRVAVDPVGMLEDLQIADEMADHEPDQDQTRNSHQELTANRRAKEGADRIHRQKLRRRGKDKNAANLGRHRGEVNRLGPEKSPY